jgi:hypothetical protein
MLTLPLPLMLLLPLPLALPLPLPLVLPLPPLPALLSLSPSCSLTQGFFQSLLIYVLHLCWPPRLSVTTQTQTSPSASLTSALRDQPGAGDVLLLGTAVEC